MRASFIFLIVVLPLFTAAQIQVTLNSGIGTYQMGELKTLQDNFLKSMPVAAQVTASFPAYWFYELTATNEFKEKFLMGGSLSYGSTGGRVYYSDYSGSLWSDQLASFYSITTLFGARRTWLDGKLSLQGDVRPGITITNLDFSSNQAAGNAIYYSQNKYHSLNLVVQPTVSLSYRWRSLSFNTFAGYNFNFAKGELQSHQSYYSQFGILYSGGNSTHVDWSGLRAGVGLGINLKGDSAPSLDRFSVGLGLGLNYGGVGMNVTTYPQKNVGVFFGVGYALAGLGTNGGFKLRLPKENKKWYPYLIGMYGYNAAIKVSNSNLSKLFYGPSFGFGFEQTTPSEKSVLWSFALLVPVRGNEVDNYINALKSSGVQFNNSLLPIAFSAGFRFNNTR